MHAVFYKTTLKTSSVVSSTIHRPLVFTDRCTYFRAFILSVKLAAVDVVLWIDTPLCVGKTHHP